MLTLVLLLLFLWASFTSIRFVFRAVKKAFNYTPKSSVRTPSVDWEKKTIENIEQHETIVSTTVSDLIEPNGNGGVRPKPGVTAEELQKAISKISAMKAIYTDINTKSEAIQVESHRLGEELGGALEKARSNTRNWNSSDPFVRAIIGK